MHFILFRKSYDVGFNRPFHINKHAFLPSAGRTDYDGLWETLCHHGYNITFCFLVL